MLTPEDDLIPLLLDAARSAGASTTGSHVVLGPGDDAAVFRAPEGHDLVWTVDDHVEDVHFRRAWGWEAVGRKAAGACLSDLAGMGAAPLGVLLSLHLPRDLDEAAALALARGVGAALAACGCPLLGGNLARHPERVAVSTSAVGSVSRGRVLTRASARPGDVLAVSGTLGLARAGLAWLEAGGAPADPRAAEAVERLLAPRPRFDVARALHGRVACMDLSDGLARDLPRLLRASGVAAIVDSDALPAPPAELAALVGGDEPARLAWLGGEDFELLLAGERAPLEGLGLDVRVIGRVEVGAPGAVRLEGRLRDDAGARAGFDHFG